jgi:hypothetical protein
MNTGANVDKSCKLSRRMGTLLVGFNIGSAIAEKTGDRRKARGGNLRWSRVRGLHFWWQGVRSTPWSPEGVLKLTRGDQGTQVADLWTHMTVAAGRETVSACSGQYFRG